jgi:hypothetical protein
MPRSPKGKKHPADVIGNAAPVCAIEFGESGLGEEDWGR